ncbi:hypothetical protein FF36_04580 [Frankia torreyi]|uniref:Uncharacterized protein n=1 Tax=Frankia torreyi TaxID=1856 RepID=A0A0D8BAD4_9ACTN|nr:MULTISPECIES: hypothetical protein [Frankia]KJE21075.1 hypothetical protein FF36_04580 [Frankia torreyi]KQM03657.1 hypothetical protein FF86_103764 [Frankia sp. CpI1-P]
MRSPAPASASVSTRALAGAVAPGTDIRVPPADIRVPLADARAPLAVAVPPRRPRVLLAPVTVTPTKPLTPSHLKGLLWTDVMYRATTEVADVTFRASPTAYHLTEQVLGFWEYLDRVHGDIDYAERDDSEIGQLYVDFRAGGGPVAADAVRPYAQAADEVGWVHPASARLLELWRGQYARMGLHDPGLTRHQPPGYRLEEALDRLAARGLCLDLRTDGGPVYLDATRFGMPLRPIVSRDGRPNYLACALRDLLPLVGSFDEVVLLHDPELDADYRLLQRVLSAAGRDDGPVIRRVAVGRVPLEGRIRSARHGDWAGRSGSALLDSFADVDSAALRLGLRLYFIAVLGPGDRQSFRPDLLASTVARAARLGSPGPRPAPASADQADPASSDASARRGPDDASDIAEFVGHFRGIGHLHVDPYRLTTRLLARRRPAVPAGLLRAVFQ